MSDHQHLARSVHDLTAAAWFGGTLMGAVGLDGATAAAHDPRERTRLSVVGWNRWRPVEIAALTAHAVAGAWLVGANQGRLVAQEGVARATAAKALVTVVGVATSAYSGRLGRVVEAHASEGGEGTTEPRPGASPELASAQRRLKVLQWVNPVLAGTVIVLGARHGELQRPRSVLGGLVHRPG